jgi:hypothetical protein
LKDSIHIRVLAAGGDFPENLQALMGHLYARVPGRAGKTLESSLSCFLCFHFPAIQ